MAKPVSQLTTRGSAVTARAFQACRLLVVLIEGHDLRPLDVEKGSEFCEIEKQGALLRSRDSPVRPSGWKADLRLRHCLFNLRGSLDRPPFIDELQSLESALRGASRETLRRGEASATRRFGQ